MAPAIAAWLSSKSFKKTKNQPQLPHPQGGNTIRQLLKIAKKTVPEEEWSRTPVVLKATAGLRLLPQDKARALLDEVSRRFGTE